MSTDVVLEPYPDASGTAEGGAPLRRPSASEQIEAALRRRILSLELAPGTSLSRQEIADRYGVSQTPVRDATLRLEQQGLITIFPQSRTVVTKIDVAHARETQFLRIALETEVGRTLSLRADRPTGRAHRILALQQAALGSGDLERFSQLDRAFHRSLCEAAGVGGLWDVVALRSGHIDRLRRLNLPDPGKAAEILRTHAEILASIDAGDRAAAETAIRSHLSGTLASVPQIVARHPDCFAPGE